MHYRTSTSNSRIGNCSHNAFDDFEKRKSTTFLHGNQSRSIQYDYEYYFSLLCSAMLVLFSATFFPQCVFCKLVASV